MSPAWGCVPPVDKPYKHGSFCTGYGGLDMAIEEFFDAETVWYSEIEASCNTLLEQHGYRNNLGDLTKIDWNEVEQVDIMSAGFPCQPFSIAGSRKGFNDERAIFEWIADGISILRPRIVVLENVGGLLTLGGTSVVGLLTRIGYDCRWSVVSASEAGAPHQRRRWFCIAEAKNFIAYTDGTRPQRHRISSITGEQGDTDTSSGTTFATNTASTRLERQRFSSNTTSRKLSINFGSATENSEQPDFVWGKYEGAIRRWEHIIGRLAPYPVAERGVNPAFTEWMMGLPENHVCNRGLSRAKELRMLGNGVVPQQALLALEMLYDWRCD